MAKKRQKKGQLRYGDHIFLAFHEDVHMQLIQERQYEAAMELMNDQFSVMGTKPTGKKSKP